MYYKVYTVVRTYRFNVPAFVSSKIVL